tara:strand:- start:811 stop:1836 length:1026 start_codon:yes stop_codon:yes gene_type:complete
MKVMSAVQARLHASMRKELRILSKIVYDFGPSDYPYQTEANMLVRDDFDGRVDVIPVSDPNSGTMAQRIMQYQAALQLSQQNPDMYDLPLLHRQMLDVLNIRDADKIVPLDDDIKPTNPVSENMNIINNKPVKAFLYQDHEAHIQAHMAFIEDPKIQEIAGKSPMAKAMQAAMAAHIQEHLAFAYRQQVEKELGVELPAEGEDLPESVELRISRLVGPAAEQLKGKNQQEAQQKKNEEQQKDPIVQMQQKELQIKEQSAQAKAQMDQARLQLDMAKARSKADYDLQKLDQDAEIKKAELAVKIAEDNAREQLQSRKITSSDQIEGIRIGKEIAESIFDGER